MGGEPKAACGKNRKNKGSLIFWGKILGRLKKSIQARDNPGFFFCFCFGQLTAHSGSPQAEFGKSELGKRRSELDKNTPTFGIA